MRQWQPAAPYTRRPRQQREEASPSPGRRRPQPLSPRGLTVAGGVQSPPPFHSTANRRRCPRQTRGPPIASKFRRLDGEKLAAAKKRVPGLRAGRDSSMINQPVGLTTTHGEKARRHVAALRQLPPTQQRDGAGHLPGAKQARQPYGRSPFGGPRSEEDHRRHLQTFSCLRAARLTANAEKCEFGKTSIEFQGHSVSANGIAPLPSRVAAIAAHPAPTTSRCCRTFWE